MEIVVVLASEMLFTCSVPIHGTTLLSVCPSSEIYFCSFVFMNKNLSKLEDIETLNREICRLHFLIQQEFIGGFLWSGTILSAGERVVNYIKPCPCGAYI